MAFSIQKTWRYDAWQTTGILRSKVIIIVGFIVALLAVLLLAAHFLILIPTTNASLGLLFILAAVSLSLFQLILFGNSYRHFLRAPMTTEDLLKKTEGNVLRAASLSAVSLLGKYLAKKDEQSALAATVRRVLDSREGLNMCSRLEVDIEELWENLQRDILPKLTLNDLGHRSLTVAKNLGAKVIAPEHVLAALLLHENLNTWLRQQDYVDSDINFAVWWLLAQQAVARSRKRWWSKEKLSAFSGVGTSWASGYTPLVDKFARIPAGNLWDQFVSGRETYIDQLIATLARQEQSNVLLVGQPGVGRLGLIKELHRKVLLGRAHPEINGQRVIYLHVGELLAQATSNASQLALVSQALREMERAGNIIAVIAGISSVLGRGGENKSNLTEVLLPFLSASTVRTVVVMSNDEYHLRVKSNEELLHFFEIVEVPSATPEVTLEALAHVAETVEQRTGIYLPYKSLRALVDTTQGVMQHIPYPEKAFDVLEESLVVAQAQDEDVLAEELVNDIVSRKVGVPVGDVKDQERERLINLDQYMHQRVVNQHIAIQAVSRAMVRARAGVRSGSKPIGSFLFLGPTGVGKTETAKTLAEVYFGSEDHMLRLDMSEFQGPDAIANLIGSQKNPVGRLTSAIADKPFTVLLLDEFEKASRAVHQMFLQVLDEGRLSDVTGKEVSFDHAIIIATSNAGAELIRKKVETGLKDNEGFAEVLKDHILENNIYRPELLNRFDGVITFTPLSEEHIRQVAKLMLAKLNKRLDYEHGITVAVTQELIDYLVRVGYDVEFGARPMARAIQDNVEYVVAQQLLQGLVKPGQQITLQPAQFDNQKN